MAAPPRIEGHFEVLEPGRIIAWVWDPSAPDRRLPVTVRVNEQVLERLVAREFRPDVHGSGKGDGRYGVLLSISPPHALRNGDVVALTVGDDGPHLPGSPRTVGDPDVRTATPSVFRPATEGHDQLDELIVRYVGGHPGRDALLARIRGGSAGAWADLVESIRDACAGIVRQDITRPYHPHKVTWPFQFYKDAEDFIELEGKSVMDFGCGNEEALGTSLLLWANGARAVTALDIVQLRSPARTARFLYELVLDLVTDPELYLWRGVSRSDFLGRLMKLRLKELQQGRIETIFATTTIRHTVGDIRVTTTGPLDAVFSQSVLEHVVELEEVLQEIHERLVPGGIFACGIDFADHRMYSSDASAWEYLLDDVVSRQCYINRVRFGPMHAMLERVGFVRLKNRNIEQAPPPQIRKRILRKYRGMSDADLEVIGSNSVFRKPR